MIDGYGEEALDLPGMEVDGEDPIDARRLQEVGEETGRDRFPRCGLPVLPRVREPRHDRGDPVGRGEPGRFDHEQELDEVVVHGTRARLDEEDVRAPDRLAVAAVRFAVFERGQLDVAQVDIQAARDLLREAPMGATGEERQRLLVRPHPSPAHGAIADDPV